LIAPGWTLSRILRSVLDYIKRIEVAGEVKTNPHTGLPEGFGGKITLREPSTEQHKEGFVSADSLLESANEALAQVPLKIWVVLDRLDVAFSDSADLEANALRALFRVYLDMIGLDNISLKVFLRDDIWQRITEGGFREASHITRYIRITWDSQSLLNLLIRRALHNNSLREYYSVTGDQVLADTQLQTNLFYRIFPGQVDTGPGKTSTLDWVLTRTRDGKKQTAPREVIHLMSSAREQQLRSLEIGNPEPLGEMLIDRVALKAGLPYKSLSLLEPKATLFHRTKCKHRGGGLRGCFFSTEFSLILRTHFRSNESTFWSRFTT
jgi:hypothetical protein